MSEEKGYVIAKVRMHSPVKFDDYAMVVVPGGMMSRELLRQRHLRRGAPDNFFQRRAWLSFLYWYESKRQR